MRRIYANEHLLQGADFMKRLYALYAALVLLSVPLLAFAEETESVGFNPPSWVAWTAVVIALALPFVLIALLRRSAEI